MFRLHPLGAEEENKVEIAKVLFHVIFFQGTAFLPPLSLSLFVFLFLVLI